MNEQKILKVYKPSILPSIISSIFVSILFFIYFREFTIWLPIIINSIYILIIYLNLKAQRYELKDDGVFIKSGIIAKSRGTLLYSQIQDVQEYQGLIARTFGVTNLTINKTIYWIKNKKAKN